MKIKNIYIASIIYLTWIIGFALYNYLHAKKELISHLDQRLELAARNFINVIPEGLHYKDMSKDSLTKAKDLALIKVLNEYSKTNNIYYIYSMILRDNKIFFTTTSATEEDIAENNGGFYFYHYDDAAPHVYNAFKNKEPSFRNIQDQWGSFRSVFIPFVANDGTEFVIGADIQTEYISTLLQQKMINTFVISLLFILFAIPFLSAFTSQTRRWASDLEKQTEKLKKNQKALQFETHKSKTNEAKLTSLVELAVDAIITIDKYGTVTAYNNAASNMFGYSATEVIGNNIKMIMPAMYKENHDKFIANYVDTEKRKTISSTVELSAQRKDGTIFPIEISVSDVKLDGEEKIFSAIIRDLTEKKEKELELHRLVEVTEKANQAKSEFLNNMSHELRTPLHGILSFAKIGIEKAGKVDDEKIKKYFTKINSSGERLKAQLDDLLDISKLESGKLEFHFDRENIQETIEACVSEQQALLKSRHISVSLDTETNNCIVECDKVRIGQVIINLLNNAIKFSPDSTSIKFKISEVDHINDRQVGALQINISDQGRGIPVENRKIIFDKFVQSNLKHDQIIGTGLGLAISRDLVMAHDGNIWCQESESGGAEFVFRIPFIHEPTL